MNLPEGFVLDQQPAGNLPEGFVLDQPSVAADVAKSGGIGLVKGGIGLAGLGGDARELNAKVINAASKAVGYELPTEKVSAALKFAPVPGFGGPTSQQLRSGTEAITGPLYEPKTTAGEYAQTAGEFVPALAGGPETLLAKLATRVAVPALASETAGQLTKGTVAEPYARTGAGMIGGLAAARTARPAVDAIPAVEQIRDAARAGYRHPDVEAIQVRPQSVEALADRITAGLNQRGQLNVPQSAGGTHDVVDRLRDTGNLPGLPQGVASIQEIRSVRSALSGMAREVDLKGQPTSNAAAAGHAGRQIDNYLNMLQQPDLVAGNAQRAAAILRQANRDWAAAEKASDIGARLTRAERQAAKSGSGTNIDNALRQKISAVLDVPSRTVGLQPAEIEQAERVVRGSVGANLARKLGKLGFGDGLSLLLHAAAAPLTLGASIPIGIAGTVARKVGEGITQRNANRLEEMIRQRSTEAERWRAIQARINAGTVPAVGAVPQGLLGGALASPQLRAGLPQDYPAQQ